jgi:hypothetical protein
MTKPIQLHVGYVGITREGKRVEITNSDLNDTKWPWSSNHGQWYNDKGLAANYYKNSPQELDIVGPWVDTPVEPPVRLHVGYVGITRERKRVEIKSSNVTGTYPWLATSLDTYTSSGHYYHCDYISPVDIVGPWVDTPVKPLVDYNDGQWHSWAGGECPVHPSSVVDCVWHDEPVNRAGTMGRIAGIDKDHSSVCWERVIKFRVTKEYVEPREFWIYNGITSDVKTEKPSGMYGYIHVREVMTNDT